jgi:hypothetical protein
MVDRQLISMLIAQRDVDHLKDLLRDVKLGRLPLTLAPSVLFAFFTENPHLLMAEAFDEHMQCPIPDDDSAWFMQRTQKQKTPTSWSIICRDLIFGRKVGDGPASLVCPCHLTTPETLSS